MPDDRFPKAVMYAELTEEQRKRGGQKLRYRDVLKSHLKAADMILTLGREKLVIAPLGERKCMMLLRLLNGSVRRNILKGGEKDILSISTTLCHHHNQLCFY